MSKPVVKFFQTIITPVVGECAGVRLAEPHPVLGISSEWVHTSLVQRVEEDGSFETLNTYYKKVE